MKRTGLLTREQIADALTEIVPVKCAANVIFVCIGTDRSTGDSLGPLVGTALTAVGYPNVYGTLDETVNAMNVADVAAGLPADKTIIAIDAALGSAGNVGTVSVKAEPIKPGAGVGKELPAVGDYGISGIVNVGGFMEYFVLQNTRLSVVTRMANDIVAAISTAIPLKQKRRRKRKNDDVRVLSG